jgi:hypothetical protein
VPQQEDVTRKVNEELVNEQIYRNVKEDVVNWNMGTFIRDHLTKIRNEKVNTSK